MKTSDFFGKFKSWYLWGNLFAMLAAVVLLCLGIKFGLGIYTHHGKEIHVPDVKHKLYPDAEHILEGLGLQIAISDTGYVKTLPPDCILEQSLAPGDLVKAGRIMYVVINSASTPVLSLPDIIDNSSYREARAKLIAMGFKVGEPEYVSGEKGWVYGIKARGRNVITGQKVLVDDVLVIQVGSGMRDVSEDVSFIDAMGADDDLPVDGDDIPAGGSNAGGSSQVGDFDDFEVVTGAE